MKTKVFISYALEDAEFVKKLHADLCAAGVDPWLDSLELTPGQDWNKAIHEAIGKCSYFIAVLSSNSVSKSGYVQKEIRRALEIADQKPEGEVYIIPVRIDDCEPSFEGLKRLHRADLFPTYEVGLGELLRAFNYVSNEKPKLTIIKEERRDGLIVRMTDKGFGFITYSYVKSDIFFHANELDGVEYNDLDLGDIVIFSIAEGPNGRVAVGLRRA